MTHSSLWGGVQTLVLTTQDLIYPGRSSGIEVNSADSAVMEIIKSNMTDMVPFQLLYYGVSNRVPTCTSVTIVGIPIANMFTLYVNVGQGDLQHFSLNKGSNQKWTAFVADVYIDGVPDGFITIPRSGTLDYQGATFFDRNFHFDLPTDLTNVSKLLFTGYFSTYRVTVDADSVTNNAVCQSGVTTEIPINQAYIGGDTANISINVII